MRIIFSALLAFWAAPAAAHIGHLGGLAGHDHWIGGAAIGIAIAIGLWGKRKGKDAPEGKDEPAAEQEEQPA